ncbi:MAG: S8 family serine peptidase [Acidobacteriota bacterium]
MLVATSKRLLIGLIFCCFSWLSITVVSAEPIEPTSRHIIIELSQGKQIESVLHRYGSTLEAKIWNAPIYRITIPTNFTVERFVRRLQRDKDIKRAWLDIPRFQLSPRRNGGSDTSSERPVIFREGKDLYERQRALTLLNVQQAHRFSRGTGALVAIIDTGCDINHPLLRGRISRFSYDFVDLDMIPDEVPSSPENKYSIYGHGTFVTGIIALAAPEAELLVLRAFDDSGWASDFEVASALRYASDHGAAIINLSFGAGERGELVAEALLYAQARGTLIVVAAGNGNIELPVPFPAAEPQVLAVAATDLNDAKARFSNFGRHISYSAPGTNLISLYPKGQFAGWSGTSFAAPWVSAALALLFADEPDLPLRAVEVLRASAINISRRNPTFLGKLGTGRISFGNALRRLRHYEFYRTKFLW